MSFLRNPLRAVFGIFSSTSSSLDTSHSKRNGTKTSRKRSAVDAFESSTLPDASQQGKRQKVGFDGDSTIEAKHGYTQGKVTSLEQPAVDRALMPPPPTNFKAHQRTLSTLRASRMSLDLAESASQATRSSRAAKSDVLDEYDMEEARRKAAATQLPANSGIWETGERELFFHLSYRGFEPILPNNWMIDFPTLPLPVFAHQERDKPLIMCHRSTQFRAIRALRELFDTGTLVRDRTVSNQDLRTEPSLEKAVNKYISWSLKDLGYPDKPSKTTLPVHTIATLHPGQSTHDVIRRLASEMHILAAKHREAVNVQPSVEQLDVDTLTPPSSQIGPTQIHSARSDGERTLPVIYGIVIASSILAIFTLNSHTPFPPFLVRTLLRNKQSPLTPERAAAINPHLPAQIEHLSLKDQLSTTASSDEDSGIRYIANFDFSNASADVWNALAIAILAMQIRKTMGEVFETWQSVSAEHNEGTPTRPDHLESEASDSAGFHGVQVSSFEDSWLSNVDGNWTGLNPSTPGSGLVDQLLSSPSRVQRNSGGRGKRQVAYQSDDDPDV